MFLSGKADNFAAQVDMAKEVAKENKGELLFVTVDTDEDDHKRIMEFFGMEVIKLLFVLDICSSPLSYKI